jgi:ATP-dependent exoDNAse (exonuclease V) beta subunit
VFGDDSVVERGARARAGPGSSVRPGLHVPQAGGHRLVWWDPAVLDLDRTEAVGLRQERILAADEAGTVAEEGVRAHAKWQEARRDALARGSRPSLDVRSVTALAAAEAGAGAEAPRPISLEAPRPVSLEALRPVSLEEVSTDRSGRPGGKRFGTLVHAVLAAVDLTADEPATLATARVAGRLVGASAEEVSAAATAVRAALAHPLLERAARAAGAGDLRRETPVLLQRDGILVEGVVDLAFRETDGPPGEGGRWTVVDFKTDREIGERRGAYEAQVRLYLEAVEAATREPAAGVLLVV